MTVTHQRHNQPLKGNYNLVNIDKYKYNQTNLNPLRESKCATEKYISFGKNDV